QPDDVDRLGRVSEAGCEQAAEQEQDDRQSQRHHRRRRDITRAVFPHLRQCCHVNTLRASRTRPGIASAAMMMSASTSGRTHESRLANEMILPISPRMIAPMIEPMMLPCPPDSRVPPSTTATTLGSV